MNLADLEKAEEIRQQIKQLEKIVNRKLYPLERLFVAKEPRFRLGIIAHYFFEDKTLTVTSEVLSDAIKKVLKQTIEDLKSQLVELGVEVE